jgi:hypothetical protein
VNPAWTVFVTLGEPGSDQRCGLEIDPHRRHLRLAPFPVGEGSEEVGRLVVFRALFDGPIDPAMAEVLRGPRAATHLGRVDAGYTSSLLWSGDRLGTWSEAAWAAAVALVEETLAADGPEDREGPA